MKNSLKKFQLPERIIEPEIEPIQEPQVSPIPEEFPLHLPPDENGENDPKPEIEPNENALQKKKTKFKVVLQERNVE